MKRLNSVRPTEAMMVDVLAKSMPGRVYNLSAGDPDLPVCAAIREAYAALSPNDTHRYGPSAGLPELRERLWPDPAETVVANGAKQLIYMTLAAVTRPGDEVTVIGPCWTSYLRICDILGLKTRFLVGGPETGYVPTPEAVRAAVTPRTAAVLINNPNNPTGAVYPAEYLEGLLETVRANGTRLIADEIYRLLTDRPFYSLRGEKDTIVIDGFSKALNLTGWRLGYAIGDPELMTAVAALQSQMSGPPSTLIQKILVRAWDGLEYAGFEEYRERIDLLCRIEKFAAARPAGGFYFYLPIADRWESSRAMCETLLERHAVALTPGDDYGVERTVRVSAASESASALAEILPVLELI